MFIGRLLVFIILQMISLTVTATFSVEDPTRKIIKAAVKEYQHCLNINGNRNYLSAPNKIVCNVFGYEIPLINEALKCPKKNDYVSDSKEEFGDSKVVYYYRCNSSAIYSITLLRSTKEWIFVKAGILAS
ncbi:hypothetical protein [Undibacterium flavidum]|uniref:Uncharacterized protein n=1 Tax=Undibacterium flavidum TaxID=2762297 RepID=A0ABR6YFS3_9BURK|nr:hypothetical protein [Undibacterium flavidum]MBC3875414.1 hypothetical protein [Undibacterium flavidum]